MKIIKKNQLAILVISLMLITAGYLNYDTNYNKKGIETGVEPEQSINLGAVGDAELVNSNAVEENKEDVDSKPTNAVTEEKDENEITEENEQRESQNISDGDNYFVNSKLERNVMYSQMIGRYQEIINSNSQASDQKSIAQQEINKINELQNAIMIAENLLSSKGFVENIIFVNGNSISVIIGKENLETNEIAQIQNIISRELTAEVDNIHISLK